ncbi:MAG: zinc metallopeptidase, partial [Clostridia bacterium]|nr:zinc metallopeptidase [Clostridia bacterium]
MLSAFFYMDYWYVVLVIPAMILSLVVQFKMRSAYGKYSQIATKSGMTGADMARQVLRDNGVNDVDVVPVSGELTDHYDPKDRVIRLSSGVYGSNSIAALGVAAHEAGHAVQHSQAYAPLKIRNNMVPAVNFASSISWWVFIIGLFADMPAFLYGGIILFSMATLFHLITLPVGLKMPILAVA